jgi:hypothetical protein
MKKMGCAQCGGAKMKKGGKVPAKKMQKGGSMGIVGMPKYGNNPMTAEGRMLQKGGTAPKRKIVDSSIKMKGPDKPVAKPMMAQKGGAFAPNRAVQASCKGGMVRDENGRCVMARKMAKGGSSFGMLSVKAGIDKNPKPTAADRIAGAKMRKRK